MNRTVVVVGKALLRNDYRELVDSADCVIRINDCKNLNGRSGEKTNILCVNNIGAPAQRFLAEKPFKNMPICAKAERFLFVRDMPTHLQFLKETGQEDRRDLFVDHTAALVATNEIPPGKFGTLSAKFNRTVYHDLIRTWDDSGIAGEQFICPSTGIFAILLGLNHPAFRDCRKFLVGFEFKGWEGHPWRTEQTLVERLASMNLLTLYPN